MFVFTSGQNHLRTEAAVSSRSERDRSGQVGVGTLVILQGPWGNYDLWGVVAEVGKLSVGR